MTPTSTLRTQIRRISADSGGRNTQVRALSTSRRIKADFGVRAMDARWPSASFLRSGRPAWPLRSDIGHLWGGPGPLAGGTGSGIARRLACRKQLGRMSFRAPNDDRRYRDGCGRSSSGGMCLRIEGLGHDNYSVSATHDYPDTGHKHFATGDPRGDYLRFRSTFRIRNARVRCRRA